MKKILFVLLSFCSIAYAGDVTITQSPTGGGTITIVGGSSGGAGITTISTMTTGATNFIFNQNTLQSGATAYPSFLQVGSSATIGSGGLAIQGDASALNEGLLVTRTSGNGYSWWMENTAAANAANYLDWAWVLKGAVARELMGDLKVTSVNVGLGQTSSDLDIALKKLGNSTNVLHISGASLISSFPFLATSSETITGSLSASDIVASSVTISTMAVTAGRNSIFVSTGLIVNSTITLLNSQPIRFSTTSFQTTKFVELRAPTVPGTAISFRLPNAQPVLNGQNLSATTSGVMSWNFGFPGTVIINCTNSIRSETTTTNRGPGMPTNWQEAYGCDVSNVTGTNFKVIATGMIGTDQSNNPVYATITCDGSDVSGSGNGLAQCFNSDGTNGNLACNYAMQWPDINPACTHIGVAFGNDDGATTVRHLPAYHNSGDSIITVYQTAP